jgi:hypothetical protein
LGFRGKIGVSIRTNPRAGSVAITLSKTGLGNDKRACLQRLAANRAWRSGFP